MDQFSLNLRIRSCSPEEEPQLFHAVMNTAASGGHSQEHRWRRLLWNVFSNSKLIKSDLINNSGAVL